MMVYRNKDCFCCWKQLLLLKTQFLNILTKNSQQSHKSLTLTIKPVFFLHKKTGKQLEYCFTAEKKSEDQPLLHSTIIISGTLISSNKKNLENVIDGCSHHNIDTVWLTDLFPF